LTRRIDDDSSRDTHSVCFASSPLRGPTEEAKTYTAQQGETQEQ
jgi:hypothetical protein